MKIYQFFIPQINSSYLSFLDPKELINMLLRIQLQILYHKDLSPSFLSQSKYIMLGLKNTLKYYKNFWLILPYILDHSFQHIHQLQQMKFFIMNPNQSYFLLRRQQHMTIHQSYIQSTKNQFTKKYLHQSHQKLK